MPDALSKRYGGSGPYTPAQVEKTIADLRLDRRYLYYAYLMYCEREKLDLTIFTDENVDNMNIAISAVAGSLLVAAPGNDVFGGFDAATDGGCSASSDGGGLA